MKYKTLLIEFHNIQKQILLGSLLGDGCISKNKDERVYYREMHGIEQENYLLWKNKILNFNFYKRKIKSLNKIRVEIRKENKKFREYYDHFYSNGEKILNKKILYKLDKLGLAIWYLDDGHYAYRTNCIVLSTQPFGLEGNRAIQKYFKEKWNIDWKIQTRYDKRYNKERYNLRVNVEETQKFISLIKSSILEIPSMHYKIGLDETKRNNSKLKNKNHYQRNKNKVREYYLKNRGQKLKYRRDYYKKYGK